MGGLSSIVPPSLAGLIPSSSILSLGNFNQPGVVGSNGDISSSNIQGTINSILSGINLKSGGSDVNYSNEGRGNPGAAAAAADAATSTANDTSMWA
jgi:hypothetical protein